MAYSSPHAEYAEYAEYDVDEAAAKKRKIEEMAFGGVDPSAADPVEQALYGRFPAKFRPRRMCNFYEKGSCAKANACTFAHSLEELHPDAQAEQQWAEGVTDSWEAPAQVGGLPEQSPPPPGEEVSFLSLATGPREFTEGGEPKELCRFFLHHPTLCLQGDSCQNAHGLSELGLDDKSVSINSSSGPTAAVTKDGGCAGCGGGKDGGKGKEGKSWWGPPGPKGGGFGADKGFDKGSYAKGMWWALQSGYGPYSKGGGYEKGGGFDKGEGKGWSKGKGDAGDGKGWSKGKGGAEKGGGFSWSKGKGDAGGKMAIGPAGPGQSRFGKGGFRPTKLCSFWQQDPSLCTRGDACTFAHGAQELRAGASG